MKRKKYLKKEIPLVRVIISIMTKIITIIIINITTRIFTYQKVIPKKTKKIQIKTISI